MVSVVAAKAQALREVVLETHQPIQSSQTSFAVVILKSVRNAEPSPTRLLSHAACCM